MSNKFIASEMYEIFNLKSKHEVVARMYVESFPTEKIAEVTGLEIERVKEQILHIKSGELICKFEIASKMISRNIEKDIIAEVTNLPSETIEELIRKQS